MKKTISYAFILAIVLFIANTASFGQGVTTAAMNGIVLDEKGEGLPGATVVAVHEPSGSKYGVSTRADGRFNLPAVRTGGPYKIAISMIGYDNMTYKDIDLALGENFDITVNMKLKSTELNEIVISGNRDAVFNTDRTGAANFISNVQMKNMPTISRSITDMTRLTPQSSGNSFAGRNNLYNNLSIDGSVFNNSFGLSSTPGGQANAQPISLDAIEQIQVSLAPYDVRQSGFTGAGINAVTRSGTNEFSASIYTFMRNEKYVSKEVAGKEVTNSSFNQSQSGFRIGGPIIKDKLFFFINGEAERRDDPSSTWLAKRDGLTGDNVSKAAASDLDALKTFLMTKYNYNPGEYENYNLKTYNNKFLVRLDYNITERHKFSIRFNYLESWRESMPSTGNASGARTPSATCMVFSNSTYKINNNIYSLIGELNSVFGNSASNNLIIGYNMFRDFRSSESDPFPAVDILSSGTTMTSFGYEQYTPNNKLNTDVFQISDNFTLYRGSHTITLGGSLEYFKFSNGFTPQFYQYYRYSSLSDFYNDVNTPGATTGPINYQRQYSALPGVDVPLAEVNAAQVGIYGQDEWNVTKRFKLTTGLRIDMPSYPVSLDANPNLAPLTFKDTDGNNESIDVSKLPAARLMWSPRIGFNYDIYGDKSTQFRGGFGIFTGRIPFVWVSNQASNNGVMFGGININSTTPLAAYHFNASPTGYIPANATAAASYTINATSDNFQFPQVFRANLALDHKFKNGWVGTLEGIFTKDINAIFHYDANYITPTTTLRDHRVLYPSGSNAYKINKNINGAYVLDNTDKGYSYFLTAQLQKHFDFGLDLMTAYTYGETQDITSSPGSIASSSFTGNAIQSNPNQPTLSYSNYDQKHKLVGSVNYGVSYLNHFSTSISLIYIGVQGGGGSSNEAASTGRFSYTYAGDLNRDGISGNDLIYIPKSQSDITLIADNTSDKRTVDEIWAQLDAFIQQDDYLRTHRGQIMKRNDALAPWNQQVDFRLTQDVYFNVAGKRNTLQFTLDILNIGNLINSNWGVKKSLTKASFISVKDFNGQGGQPRFSFPYLDAANKIPLTSTYTNNTGLGSRWQVQFGLRYIFN